MELILVGDGDRNTGMSPCYRIGGRRQAETADGKTDSDDVCISTQPGTIYTRRGHTARSVEPENIARGPCLPPLQGLQAGMPALLVPAADSAMPDTC